MGLMKIGPKFYSQECSESGFRKNEMELWNVEPPRSSTWN